MRDGLLKYLSKSGQNSRLNAKPDSLSGHHWYSDLERRDLIAQQQLTRLLLSEQSHSHSPVKSQLIASIKKSFSTDLLSLADNVFLQCMDGIQRFEWLAEWEYLRMHRIGIEVSQKTIIDREFDQEVVNLWQRISI